MGRAKRWLRTLLGGKKETNKASKVGAEPREKRRWSFTKPSHEAEEETTTKTHVERRWLRTSPDDMAAAAVRVAAAHAAVVVSQLKSRGNGLGFRAAVRIQTAFRSYLARKALRALKALVKLQSLVRGYLVRRRAAAALRGMQALVRAQAMARSQRVRTASRRSLERVDDLRSEEYLASPSFRSRRLSAPMESYDSGDSPKILEVDPGRPRARIQKMSNLKTPDWVDENSSLQCCKLRTRVVDPSDWGFSTTQCTPRVVTPSKSTFSGIYRQGNSERPSYMAKTQSSKAKINRSLSAPKQRPEPKKRVSLAELVESRSSLSGIGMQRSCSKAQEAVAFRVERSSELSSDCYVRDYHFHGRW